MNDGDEPLSAERLQEEARRSDAVLTLLTDGVDADLLRSGDRLKCICNVAVGFDNIDVPAATAAGIAVTNTPGVLTDTTADFAFALLMAIARRVVEGDRYARAGRYTGWGIQLLLGADITGATLGIVGMGRIGQGMAKRAAGFDMTILYSDEVRQPPERERELNARYVDLDELFAVSDFVSLHTPLTPETRHLVSWERLNTMKPTACIINTSRGPVINEPELARALREGRIAGAALDVFENEPAIYSDLLDLENVILTPHIASASVATRTRMATMAAENCLALLAGERPPNILNPEVLESPQFRRRFELTGASA